MVKEVGLPMLTKSEDLSIKCLIMTRIVTNAIIVGQIEATTNIQMQEVATSKDTVANSDHLHVTALAPAQAVLLTAIDYLLKTMEKEEVANQE